MVTAPIRGRAFGDIFWLVQDGGVAKIRAKRMFCLGHVLSQVRKEAEAHANFSMNIFARRLLEL